MKLINGILRPGEVLEILDNGKIRASAPGLFSSKDKNNLPPIMPFWELVGSHANSFSTPILGDEIWVLNLTDNPLQLYWFRKDNHIEANKEIFDETGTTNVEILCNRETGMSWASLYFSDGTGWVLRNDDSKLQIHQDGSIELSMNWPSRAIKIDSDAIHLGGSDKEQPAVYGDELVDILVEICGVLEAVALLASANPYTSHLSTALNKASEFKDKIPGILSDHVKID